MGLGILGSVRGQLAMPRLRLATIDDQHSVDARAAAAAEILAFEARRWRYRHRIRLADVMPNEDNPNPQDQSVKYP